MNSTPKASFARKSSTWCRKRTNIEKRLMWVTCIGILVIIILLTVFGIILDRSTKKGYVCSHPSCVHAASTILKYIDQKIQPCDDFYEFACGKYLKTTNIPEDRTIMGSFVDTSELVVEQLKALVQEPIDPKEPRQYHLLKKLYNICMNVTAIEEDGLKTIKVIIKELGGWPVLEGAYWNEISFDWKQSVFLHRKIGFWVHYFIYLYIYTDSKNSSKRIITLDQPIFRMSREFLIKGMDEKFVKAYYDLTVDIAVMFGANRDSARREMMDTLNFEITLANLTLPKEERRNSSLLYNPMTIEELQRAYPSMNWVEYIYKVMDVPDIEINEQEVVVVATPQVLTDIFQLLRRTPKRIQANYIMKNAVLSVLSLLTEDIRKRELEFSKSVVGTTERKPRWKECVSIATGSIHLATGTKYVRKHFDLEAKHIAEEMVEGIRDEFLQILRDVDWMDDQTRSNAVAKARAMGTHIGFPIELLDEKKVEKFYTNLEFDTNSYLKSVMQLYQFFTDYNYKQLRKPVNKTDWLDHSFPTVVNAFYSWSGNSIEFPAGILQGIFFEKNRPRYLNYGAIGYIIGHEITHGFDDIGRQYDKDGNLNDWWNENTKQAFIKKSECIIEQYGNYTVPEIDMQINGINTQGENIADNGGIKEAYLAYLTWTKKNGLEPMLPGMDYTPNQLFWISAANTWCSTARKEMLKIAIATDYHSNERFRVLGPLRNSEYFSKDFNCPRGSKMNPEHKCQVW